MFNKSIYGFVVFMLMAVVVAFTSSNKVFADCEPNYGGGETCSFERSFEIEKKVRIKGDNSWKDKVTDVDEGAVIEFRIRAKNTGDVTVDDMKMEDFLPDELIKIGGSGLTEYWDDFEPGETREFVIRVEIDSNEFDRENFDKCVVNKVELTYDNDFVGSDTATVCYGDSEITELPETGPESTIALIVFGFALILTGSLVRKAKVIS